VYGNIKGAGRLGAGPADGGIVGVLGFSSR